MVQKELYNIFDSHAHYDDDWFDSDREQVLSNLPNHGVCAVVNASVDLPTAKTIIGYAEKYSHMYATVGFHPEKVNSDIPKDFILQMTRLLKHEKAVAIGEIGLDYHWDTPRDLQKIIFEKQLILANELDMPVVVHDREAHGDTMQMLNKYKPKGLIHCFSGSVEMMREVIKLGMYISLGGVVTFKNARHSVDVAREIPIDRLLLETDAPYLAPIPFRGKRCDSSMIAYTAQRIAQIRCMEVQELLNITKENAMRMYNVKM